MEDKFSTDSGEGRGGAYVVMEKWGGPVNTDETSVAPAIFPLEEGERRGQVVMHSSVPNRPRCRVLTYSACLRNDPYREIGIPKTQLHNCLLIGPQLSARYLTLNITG